MPKSEVYNMDNMEFMKGVPDKFYSLAIVDPPYGISIAEWDKSIPNESYFKELFRVSINQIIWGGNYFNLPHKEGWICWDKTFRYNQKLTIGEFEMVWTSLDIKATFCRFTYCGNFYGWQKTKAHYDKPNVIHPTQKPIDIYQWLLKNYAKPGDTILDTHLGSGSSRIACYDAGLDFTGIEIDKEYFDASVKRFENFKAQLTLTFHE